MTKLAQLNKQKQIVYDQIQQIANEKLQLFAQLEEARQLFALRSTRNTEKLAILQRDKQLETDDVQSLKDELQEIEETNYKELSVSKKQYEERIAQIQEQAALVTNELENKRLGQTQRLLALEEKVAKSQNVLDKIIEENHRLETGLRESRENTIRVKEYYGGEINALKQQLDAYKKKAIVIVDDKPQYMCQSHEQAENDVLKKDITQMQMRITSLEEELRRRLELHRGLAKQVSQAAQDIGHEQYLIEKALKSIEEAKRFQSTAEEAEIEIQKSQITQLRQITAISAIRPLTHQQYQTKTEQTEVEKIATHFRTPQRPATAKTPSSQPVHVIQTPNRKARAWEPNEVLDQVLTFRSPAANFRRRAMVSSHTVK